MKKKLAPPKEKLYHIGISRENIENAKIALLPGDPNRSGYLAKMLNTNAKPIASNREYTSYLAESKGQKILVISTGMGAPSVAIGLEELALLGVKKFIRIGTTGTIQEHIRLGDLIINNAAVRLEGTSSQYAPIEYPAVSDLELTHSLVSAAQKLSLPYHLGIGASTDSFWPAQERYDGYSGFVLRKFQGSLSEWRKLGVLNYEMEASCLFTVANVFGMQASSICCVIAKRTQSEVVDKSKYDEGMKNIIKIIQEIL